VNLTEPRQPYTWLQPTALHTPKNPEETPETAARKSGHRKLTSPARGLLGMLLARYNPGPKAPETYADAYAAITRFGIGLFGTSDT